MVLQIEQLQTAVQVWPYGQKLVDDPSHVLLDPCGDGDVLPLVQDEDVPGEGGNGRQQDVQAELTA